MKRSLPQVGQIINYWYLWKEHADKGQEEGRKPRPCLVVTVTKSERVAVSPITHTPQKSHEAIEIPPQEKRGTRLDDERSWLVTNEVNHFQWRGPDVEPLDRRKPEDIYYGRFHPGFVLQAREETQKRARGRHVNRDVEQPQHQDKSRTQTQAKAKPQDDPAKTKAPDKSKADLFKQARDKGKDNPKDKGRGR